jgi:Ca2+-binding RTX toxin-like protein
VTVALAALNAKVDLVDGVSVRTSVDATLGAGAKNLVLLGIDGIDATGNASANALSGNAGANVLSGYGGAATLYGAAGNDILSGGTGADRMLGGGGRDTYVVGQPGDVVVEEQGNGIDTIKSSITRALPANVENLTLTGTAATDGAGNALANVILGSRGDNALDGVGGSDTLTGGAGADSFVFSAAPGAANIDRITDFSVSADTIVLDDAVFAAAGAPGVLAAAAFCAGAAALDASDRIIHDPATGSLFYDSDGNGEHAAIAFAMLPAGLVLTPTDFLIA